ncbi:hypothetical protein OHA55_33950 [Streptomyces sp. NBC_00102]|nr:hypothetical protein [Streptomyces sp. NBC_00102]
MASTERDTDRQAGYTCPACGRPVESEVVRRKTLGIFVPRWGPGACHHADCPRSADEPAETGSRKRHVRAPGRADPRPYQGRHR